MKKIAVVFPKEKWDRMHFGEQHPADLGITFVHVSPSELPNIGLEEFDGMLHKFTYEMLNGDTPAVIYSIEYQSNHPSFKVVDPIENIRPFIDRKALDNKFKSLSIPNVVYETGIDLKEYKEKHGSLDNLQNELQFPILAKPRLACGTPDTHKMLYIPSWEVFQQKLDEIQNGPMGMIAYHFIDHNAVVYKCYSLNGTCGFSKKPSLSGGSHDAVAYNSQKPIPEGLKGEHSQESIGNAEEIDIRPIAQMLAEMSGVNLLGFDVLRDSTGVLHIVDVNYFPEFSSLTNMHQILAQYILQQFNVN